MARSMASEANLFRAVVEMTFKDGSTQVKYHGPFTAKAPATSVINEEKHVVVKCQNYGWGWHSPYTLNAYVEKCTPTWGKSDD